jgi:catechol-2,3-dioxygenase
VTVNTDGLLGPVYLTVADLERTVNFYQNSIGLQVRNREGEIAYLGAGDEQRGSITLPSWFPPDWIWQIL